MIGEGVGFGAGSRYLVATGFALTAVGAAMVVRSALAIVEPTAPALRQPAGQPV